MDRKTKARHMLSAATTATSAVAVGFAFALPLITNSTPLGGFVGPETPAARASLAPQPGIDFDLPKGCTTKPFLTDKVLVIPNDYAVMEPLVYTFDQAQREGRQGLVWVVGYCH